MGPEEITSFESVAEKLLIGFEQFFAVEQKKSSQRRNHQEIYLHHSCLQIFFK